MFDSDLRKVENTDFKNHKYLAFNEKLREYLIIKGFKPIPNNSGGIEHYSHNKLYYLFNPSIALKNTIEEWTNIMKGNINVFNKEDIKAGYLIELNNNELCLVNYNNRDILGIKGQYGFYNDVFCIKEDFTICDAKECGVGYNARYIPITKIYGRTFNGMLNDYSTKDRKLLWSQNKYRIGDKFLIKNIKQITNFDGVQEIINCEQTIFEIKDTFTQDEIDIIYVLKNAYGMSLYYQNEDLNKLKRI